MSDVTGPWNLEAVQAWARHVTPLANQLAADGGVQVGIAIIRESMLCPPDALALLDQAVLYSVEKLGCIAHLIVADENVEGRRLMMPTFARIYEGRCVHQVFTDLEQARAFAAELLRARA